MTILRALEEIYARTGLNYQEKALLMKDFLSRVSYAQARF